MWRVNRSIFSALMAGSAEARTAASRFRRSRMSIKLEITGSTRHAFFQIARNAEPMSSSAQARFFGDGNKIPDMTQLHGSRVLISFPMADKRNKYFKYSPLRAPVGVYDDGYVSVWLVAPRICRPLNSVGILKRSTCKKLRSKWLIRQTLVEREPPPSCRSSRKVIPGIHTVPGGSYVNYVVTVSLRGLWQTRATLFFPSKLRSLRKS